MKFTKFAIVLLFLFSLIAFALTVTLFSVRENEKEKRIRVEQINTELEGEISALRSDKQRLEEHADDLDRQLKEAERNLDSARTEAEQAKQELSESRKSLETQASQTEELRNAVRVSQERNRELEETLDKLEKTLQEMRQSGFDGPAAPASDNSGFQISTAPETITVETADKSKVMELAPPSISAVQEPAQKASERHEKKSDSVSESLQAGRVLLVNQKFNFVIINMGSKHGLKIGDSFLVTENGEKVVKVQVEKLYDDYSAAKILEVLGNRLLLKEGNLVTRI